MGLNNGGHTAQLGVAERFYQDLGKRLTLQMPVKQRADCELFDGEPIYSGKNGIDIPRRKIIALPRHELSRLGPVADNPAEQRAMEAAGLVDAHLGLMLPVKNRKWLEQHHNTITQLGLNALADKIVAGSAVTLPNGMKLGSTSTTASLGDTDILDGSPPTGAYQAFSTGYPSASTQTASWRTFWDAGEATDASLQEVVMKSADGSTDAISRIVFTLVNKGASDTYQITIQWVMAEA